MTRWYESKKFERFIEILPGIASWLFILSPIVVGFVAPQFLGAFILFFAIIWLGKALNISRHLIIGFTKLRRNMKIDWLEVLRKTESIKKLESYWEKRYESHHRLGDLKDLTTIKNLEGAQSKIKNWKDIYHVAIFAVSNERIDITEPSIKALLDSNYPKDKIIVVFAAESRFKEGFSKDIAILQKKYGHYFADFRYYYHKEKEGEVIGKGANITNAGRNFWAEYRDKGIAPENMIVTTLDADHLPNSQYFARLSYLYVIDPNRSRKTYQPIPLLFNNIWDVPAVNRIAAVSASFWQVIEGMRPYKLRTFAAHAQTMETLLITDFWKVDTIVEDGHQYWRTYFAYNGDFHMVPMYIPVYQDAVLGNNLWESTKNQYKQKRRWSWGVTDLPFVVVNCIKHNEIPLFERILQVYRQFISFFTWASASFFLATSWIPLALNKGYQDTVFAHNATIYASDVLTYAWFGVFVNYWISLFLFPPKPKKYGYLKNLEMVVQWILAPLYAIFILSLPALESQTRLIMNKRLGSFWITPKIRKSEVIHKS